MKDGGAENRIWASQFGFKTGRGTADYLLFVRRVIQQNLSKGQDNSLLLLALDWAKAFDSIVSSGHEASLRPFIALLTSFRYSGTYRGYYRCDIYGPLFLR